MGFINQLTSRGPTLYPFLILYASWRGFPSPSMLTRKYSFHFWAFTRVKWCVPFGNLAMEDSLFFTCWYVSVYVYSVWWFVTWMLWFSIYWEFHHPNWRTHIFQRGRYTTNQYLYDVFLHVHIQKFVMSIDRLCVSICLRHFCVQNDNSPENHLRLSAGWPLDSRLEFRRKLAVSRLQSDAVLV